MRINKKVQAMFEWILALILIILCFNYSYLGYGSFTAIGAHNESEKTLHYGPSSVAKTIDLDGGKLFLCRYKDWFSVDTIKHGFIKWYPGDYDGGCPIDYTKKVTCSWGNSHIKDEKNVLIVFGYVNDNTITQIIVEYMENGLKTQKYNIDKSKLFIFYWYPHNTSYDSLRLKGIDKQGNIILEQKLS